MMPSGGADCKGKANAKQTDRRVGVGLGEIEGEEQERHLGKPPNQNLKGGQVAAMNVFNAKTILIALKDVFECV